MIHKLKYVLDNYLVEKNKKNSFKNNKLGNIVREEIPEYLAKNFEIDNNKYCIKGSIGQDQWANIPWISIFDREVTDSVQKGYYIVFLFKSDMSGMYLSLNQGYTYYLNEYGSDRAKEILKNNSNIYYNSIEDSISKERKFLLGPITLINKDIKKDSLAKGYEVGNTFSLYYDKDNIFESKLYIEDSIPKERKFLLGPITLINKDIKKDSLAKGYEVGNIFSLYYDKDNILESKLYDDLKKFFNYYDSLKNKLDTLYINKDEETNSEEEYQYKVNKVKENVIQKDVPITLKEQNKTIVKSYKRDSANSIIAINQSNFKCEIDNDHLSFIARSSKKEYMEAHHLIPMKYQNEFEYSLDVPANIICLCPLCHKKIHYGEKNEVKKLVELLYNKRKERLDKVKLFISLEKLESFY